MQPCSNPDCLYLHEIGSQEDSFTKDEIVSEYTRYLHLDSFNYFFYHFILLDENAALWKPPVHFIGSCMDVWATSQILMVNLSENNYGFIFRNLDRHMILLPPLLWHKLLESRLPFEFNVICSKLMNLLAIWWKDTMILSQKG